jgi:hypothetical protein
MFEIRISAVDGDKYSVSLYRDGQCVESAVREDFDEFLKLVGELADQNLIRFVGPPRMDPNERLI